VVGRQARLVAQWCQVGFIHGVMNTDNMTVSGETIDYGPCAFLDEYDPEKVFSSIDHQGRYAFQNQPRAALWNLGVLAHCLLPLIDSDEASAALAEFTPLFQTQLMQGAARKMALDAANPNHAELVREFFALMRSAGADYTRTFRDLSRSLDDGPAAASLRSSLGSTSEVEPWLSRWRAAAQRTNDMLQLNPAYIPRNHLVERAIDAAVRSDDWTVMDRLLEAVRRPFEERAHLGDLMQPPRPEERVTATFCGT
jgi:uncharacterized protein YdiU (UPF0061 family)